MDEFLFALKRGIVVRRHRPHAESAFIKLFSVDGCDTIQFFHVASDEAMIAFKEQAVRFNRCDARSTEPLAANASQCWSREIANKNLDKHDTIQNFNLPKLYCRRAVREAWPRTQGNAKKKAVDMATRAMYRGEIRTADVVSVHPAIHPDPFSGAPANEELQLPEHGNTSIVPCSNNIWTPWQVDMCELQWNPAIMNYLGTLLRSVAPMGAEGRPRVKSNAQLAHTGNVGINR